MTDDATTTVIGGGEPDTNGRHRSNPLDALRQETQRKISREPVTLLVPAREGWAVRFDTNIDGDQFQAWMNKCQDKRMNGGQGGVDMVKLSSIVLANQSEAIVYEGEDVWADDDEDDLIDLAHPSFLELVDARRAIDAVRKWYVHDADMLKTFNKVLEEAGYDESDLEAIEDPTGRS